MELKYLESDIAKKKLKIIKGINLFYSIIIVLLAIIVFILCLDAKKIGVIIVFLIIYIVVSLFVRVIKMKHINMVINKTLLDEICIDGVINMHIYNTKKYERLFSKLKLYDYSLLNLVDAYYRRGEHKKADEIIKFLEQRKTDNLIKSYLIKFKADKAYKNRDVDDFYLQYRKFEEISSSLSRKKKEQFLLSLNLQKNILENNEKEVNKICDNLINSKILLNEVVGNYYKGVILETNNNDGYKKFYKFVVENGNDLNIAKVASEKLGIAQQINYKNNNVVANIIMSFILIVFLFITLFVGLFYVENSKDKKWDTGIVYIYNRKVELPCTISEFEDIMRIKIDTNEIDEFNYYKLKDYNRYIELFIEDNVINGVKIDISNIWNEDLNVELGDMVVFPEKITVNSKIEDIKESYKTGIINSSMKYWSEEIKNRDKDKVIYSYGYDFKGEKFDLSIVGENGKNKSIFYYYK